MQLKERESRVDALVVVVLLLRFYTFLFSIIQYKKKCTMHHKERQSMNSECKKDSSSGPVSLDGKKPHKLS